LVVTHEETSQVKRAKIDFFGIPNMNFFFMNDSESIDDMITRFTKNINGIAF